MKTEGFDKILQMTPKIIKMEVPWELLNLEIKQWFLLCKLIYWLVPELLSEKLVSNKCKIRFIE